MARVVLVEDDTDTIELIRELNKNVEGVYYPKMEISKFIISMREQPPEVLVMAGLYGEWKPLYDTLIKEKCLPKRTILWSGDFDCLDEAERCGVETCLKSDGVKLWKSLRE